MLYISTIFIKIFYMFHIIFTNDHAFVILGKNKTITTREYGYNHRGLLVYKGYTYTKTSINGKDNIIYWRCSQYKKSKCRAAVRTTGKELSLTRGEHNHPSKSHKIFDAKIWSSG